MQREIVYTWCWSELDKRKWSITKKIFEGDSCVFSCTLDPVAKPEQPLKHQSELSKLFKESWDEFNEA